MFIVTEYAALNAKVSQPFNICIFVSMVQVIQNIFNYILCSCTMRNDLLLVGFEHTFHSDVIMTSVFFNNLSLAKRLFS